MSEIREMADILVPLHRQAVERTVALLFERSDLPEFLMQPTLQRAGEFYDRIRPGEGLLACHADPFDSACEFSVVLIPYAERLALFERVREGYEAIMRELDKVADTELEARLGPRGGFAPG